MKTLVLIFICFISFNFFSQNWLDSLPENISKNNLTFYDYQRAFNAYWSVFNVKDGYYTENGIVKKAIGWKQFKRWEYEMKFKIDKQTGEIPLDFIDVVNVAQNRSEKSAGWKSIGANNSLGGYEGIGRINCIAFHPSNNNKFWVGAASGGVWVTNDNGLTWSCLTDNLEYLTVSDIIIPTDYATSQTIYVATGDKHGNSYTQSLGVIKSTDGGVNWSNTGLTFSFNDNKCINRLLINPQNNSELIAATSDGLYKTSNSGSTWNVQLTSLTFVDVKYNPTNSSIIYGSTSGGKIYTSTNSGSTWNQVYSNSSAGIINLAVSVDEPTWVYAVAGSSGCYGVLKSTNSGTSFSQIFSGSTTNLFSYDAIGSGTDGIGWYASAIATSPLDANILLVGSVNTWRSTNGGISFQIANNWLGESAQAVHCDKHMLKFKSNGELFECNDGGVYHSTNNGVLWTDKTNGMTISQVYKLSVSQRELNQTLFGAQDNGTKFSEQGNWSSVLGGDGTDCAVSYSNGLVQYASAQNGQFRRTLDGWATMIDMTNQFTGTGNWVTPIAIHPTYSNQLFLGYSQLLRSIDGGGMWVPNTTLNTDNNISCIEISSANPNVMYVSDDDNIWKSIDNGVSWININANLPLTNNIITCVETKHNDASTIWVTMSGFNAQKVYQSINGGSSWDDISAGLPQIPIYTIIQNTQSIGEVQLYVSTEKGVLVKKGLNDWVNFNTSLPSVRVSDIEIYYDLEPNKSIIRAGTFGRGVWESTVETPVVSCSILTTDLDSTICSGTPAVLSVTNSASSTSIVWKKSTDGFSNWTVVSNGTGFNTANLTTVNLTSTLFYKANLTVNGTIIETNPIRITIVNCASLEEKNASKIVIYPNPTNGKVTIKSEEVINSISIVDISGKIVLTKIDVNLNNEFTLDLSELTKGIYFIKIYHSENIELVSKIIVK